MLIKYILNYLISNNIALFGGIVREFILSFENIENLDHSLKFISILSKTTHDIDCIMSEKQYSNLFFFLKKQNIFFEFEKYIREEYIPFEDSNNLIVEFTTIKIIYENSSKNITLDIFVHKKDIDIYDAMDIIVGTNIDFYCNCLRYVNNSISISKNVVNKYLKNNVFFDKFEDVLYTNILIFYYYDEKNTFIDEYNNMIVLNDIIKQIKAKTAISINNPDNHRIQKMMLKNWLVIN